jgi:serine/threonine-protein kinase HipA
MRRGEVRMHNQLAGYIWQDADGYFFQYNPEYLISEQAEPVSLTLPLKPQIYQDKVLFPFFDGLIPEGWLLDIAQKNWKLNPRDRMGLLLTCCRDCIGAVSVFEVKE